MFDTFFNELIIENVIGFCGMCLDFYLIIGNCTHHDFHYSHLLLCFIPCNMWLPSPWSSDPMCEFSHLAAAWHCCRCLSGLPSTSLASWPWRIWCGFSITSTPSLDPCNLHPDLSRKSSIQHPLHQGPGRWRPSVGHLAYSQLQARFPFEP